ncbi:helix-turn-helix transcriptional regulator [Achromobacter xylosoxidans]|nr:helix-turn-helix transcriptional regulator [Achromobacter xylosoxidans]
MRIVFINVSWPSSSRTAAAFFMASTQSGAPGLASAPPLRKFHRLRPGLSLQLACEAGGESSTGLATVDDSLRIVLVLDGRIDVSYGRAALNLVRGQGADAGLVMLREPEECRRVVRGGESSRRVSIGVSRQWLEQSLGETAVIAPHLATRCWSASTRIRLLAEQLLSPPPMPRQLGSLYLECRAIELVIEALSHGRAGDCHGTDPMPLPAAVHRRMVDLTHWLRRHADQPLSIDQIARHMNTTATTLQRHFRQALGITVFDFLQHERLRLARHALESEGVSVTQAAAMAGYANPGSFSTAFRRHFGLTPNQVRARL